MTWIKLFTALPRHPKTLRLARALGVRARDAWSAIASVWIYAAEFAQDGDVTDLCSDGAALAGLLEIEIAAAEHVAAELIASGFLDRDGARIVIHDWADGGGALAEKRTMNALRQARHRERNALRNAPVTVTSRTSNALEERRGEERRINDANASLSAVADREKSPHVPYADFFALYGEFSPPLKPLPTTAHTDEVLRTSVRRAWSKHPTMDWWRIYFGDAVKSDFLIGKSTDFVASLPWLIGPKNMAKVLGGAYANNGRSKTRIALDDGERWGE